jgi:hypothetical protein
MWLVDGLGILSGTIIIPPGTGLSLVRVGDFNGDGKTDLLWQRSDRASMINLMNGLSLETAVILTDPGTSWSPLP